MNNLKNVRNRTVQIVVGIVTLLVLVVIGIWSTRDNDKTQVILRNSSQCPEITMILVSIDGEDRFSVVAKPGEEQAIDIRPNIEYGVEIISNNETPDGRCIFSSDPSSRNIDRATIVVPAGTSQTFNIESEAVPTATPFQ